MHRYGDVEPNLQGRGHLKPNFTGDLCARSSITLRYHVVLFAGIFLGATQIVSLFGASGA